MCQHSFNLLVRNRKTKQIVPTALRNRTLHSQPGKEYQHKTTELDISLVNFSQPNKPNQLWSNFSKEAAELQHLVNVCRLTDNYIGL